MKENKKNLLTILIMLLTAVLGTVNLVVESIFELILTLWLCTIVSIPMIYFAYTSARWHNIRHTFWHERENRTVGEPSELSIFLYKLSGWFLFGVGMIVAIFPNFY